MSILKQLKPDQVLIDNISQSKTAALMHVGEVFAKKNPGLNEKTLFNAYWQRESLGSTALGNGVAIPHIRHTHVKTPQVCFIRLAHPVDFGAEDNQPVDLVFALLMPDNEPQLHLKVLSELVEQIKDSNFCKKCRHADSKEELYDVISEIERA